MDLALLLLAAWTVSQIDVIGGNPHTQAKSIVLGAAKTTIVHIRDWHYVPRDLLKIDLEHAKDRKLSDAEMDKLFAQHLDEVEKVQREQEAVLRYLASKGHRRILIEGLTPGSRLDHEFVVGVLEDGIKLQIKSPELRMLLLRQGATVRPALEKLINVAPLDDDETLEAAKPISNGKIKPDPAKIEARHEAMVRRCMKAGGVVVIVLGASHDLASAVRKLGDGQVSYLMVTTKTVSELSDR